MSKKVFICLAVVALCATTATAVPVTLPTGEPTVMKLRNFENILDTNGNGVFGDVGDDLEGIIIFTSIGTIGNPNLLSAQITGGNLEVTGYFKLSIVGGVAGGPHADFAIQAGEGIWAYYDTSPDWSPGAASNAATDIMNATDGMLWVSVTPTAPGWYEGVGDIVGPQLVNVNFANLTVNNSGYKFLPQLFGALVGDPTAHVYLGNAHADHKVDVMFKSRLFAPSGANGWAFRSEDPLYLWVVPEPGTFVLLGAGIAGLGLLRLRRRRK